MNKRFAIFLMFVCFQGLACDSQGPSDEDTSEQQYKGNKGYTCSQESSECLEGCRKAGRAKCAEGCSLAAVSCLPIGESCAVEAFNSCAGNDCVLACADECAADDDACKQECNHLRNGCLFECNPRCTWCLAAQAACVSTTSVGETNKATQQEIAACVRTKTKDMGCEEILSAVPSDGAQ